MGLRIRTGHEQTSWLLMYKHGQELNLGGLRTNPASGEGGDLNLELPNCKSSALTAQLPPVAM